MKNFEKTLPENYREVYSIDANNTKTGIILNVIALGVTVLASFVMVALFFAGTDFSALKDDFFRHYRTLYLFLPCFILYFVLHECTHGVAYHFLTRQKLTFGLTLTVAFCGVPDIYVNKKTALIAVLAPFIVFDIVFLCGVFFLPGLWKLYAAFLFVFHFGGCVGDLFDAFLLLFRLKGNILMKDTGPKQTFYSDSFL